MHRQVCYRLFVLYMLCALLASPNHTEGAVEPNAATHTVILGLVVFPPYSVPSDKDTCEGPYIDATKRLFANSDITLKIVCAPAARIYRMMGTNDIDFTINVKSTKALLANADFFPIPFSYLKLVLYQYEDAREKSISAIRAFDYGGLRTSLANEGFRFIDVPSAEDAVNLFIKQRSEYLISYAAPFDSYLATYQPDLQRNIIHSEIQRIETYFALNKTSEKHGVITSWLTKVTEQHSDNITLLDLSIDL